MPDNPSKPRRTIDIVACPKCGAAVGKPCVTPSGVVRHDYPHKARYTLSLKAAS